MSQPLNILILGRGRMGRAIEACAQERGHTVVGLWGRQELAEGNWPEADVAIDFTLPESAPDVFAACRERGLLLVSGTTGWADHFDRVQAATREAGHGAVWAPNFSVGVHLFRKALAQVASTMQGHDFKASVTETHHTGKVDAPSGTALAIAEDVRGLTGALPPIDAARVPGVPGTHRVTWEGQVDLISIEHAAKDRSGFARGAVMAAEWLAHHPGPFTKIFSMEDVWG